ncbi:MAG: twitching motility protein [Myxococcales bacterium]|nr:twitching motility protein [Myxococcales bacterium]
MGAQLDQVLNYLDRDGVTEMVISVGRPITLRRAGQIVPVTNAPVSRAQLMGLLQGSSIVALLPATDGVHPSADVEVGARRLRVQISRRGDEYMLKIERAPAAPVPAAPPAFELELEVAPEVAPPRRSAPVVQPPARAPISAPSTFELELDPSPARAPMTSTRPIDLELEPQIAPPVRAAGAPATRAVATPPTGSPRMASAGAATSSAFGELVRLAQDRGASDLHIATGRVTSIRVLGELVPVDPGAPPATDAQVQALLGPLIQPHQEKFDEVGYIDLAVDSPNGGRLRTNLSKHQGGLKGTFRIARPAPPTLEELGLPKELAKVIGHHQGLVVIAGPSGHGKTTTLAALVDIVNASRAFHIITIEDPVEIIYPRKAAVVSQREVGPHTRSFAAALKGSLREDPDVIVIGELRDRETVEIALTAAETGHLVIATMSTPSAAKTIDRLVDMFPPDDQSQVRASIAGALRAIVSQRLLPAANGTSVVAAVELLTGCLPLQQMIRDDKLYQLPNLMQRGRAFGMLRFDDSLTELVKTHRITVDTAIATTENKRELTATLRGGGAPPPEAAPRKGLGGLFGKKDRE